MTKVFIGMPVYNGSRFIKEAIDSLLNQSFSDFTLFISDDDSKDNTENICRNFAKNDIRIEYYRQKENLGLFNNFKFVLDKADAEYFMWSAQDDIREKDYLKVCIEHLESNKNLGFATTCIAIIDSYSRVIKEETEVAHLSGKPGIISVTRYTLQPEILGKCNLMYGLFRMRTIRETWKAYPQRHVWGQDYMFSLALISRFEIYIDEKILWKKRMGGFSSPNALSGDRKEEINKIIYENPKNHMFPFERFGVYYRGHMEALRGTPYRPLVAILLLIRLPRSFIIYLRERNVKKYIKRIINK